MRFFKLGEIPASFLYGEDIMKMTVKEAGKKFSEFPDSTVALFAREAIENKFTRKLK